MREISSSITFEIGNGETLAMKVARSTKLVVHGGAIWVTRSDDVEDYWLNPGSALHLRRGERLWLSVEGSDTAQVRFVAPLGRQALVVDWLAALSERWVARWRAGWLTV